MFANPLLCISLTNLTYYTSVKSHHNSHFSDSKTFPFSILNVSELLVVCFQTQTNGVF